MDGQKVQQAGGQLGQKYGDRAEIAMGSGVTRNICIPLWVELLSARNPRSQSRDLPCERTTRPLSSSIQSSGPNPLFWGPRPATGHRPCSVSAARPGTPALPTPPDPGPPRSSGGGGLRAMGTLLSLLLPCPHLWVWALHCPVAP